MGGVELVLVAIGLSMDAFAVSVCKGLTMRRIDLRYAVVLALFFGGFQALMPLIGWALGSQMMWLIAPIDHWVAFGLLAFIGGKMLAEALGESTEVAEEAKVDRVPIDLKEMLVLAIATSIDALAVGISLAALGATIATPATVIGIITFMFTLAGVAIGNAFGSRYEKPASIAGGVILILIGLKVLLEHLGMLPF